MKKMILAVTLLALTAGITMGADMIAGNPKNGANVVGTVDVSDDGTDLTVVYTITDANWVITETHLHVGTSPADFPKWPKDPPPGQFAYSDSNDVSENVQEVTYIIPLADIPADPGQTLYVAAHAVVGTACPCESYTCEDLDLPGAVIVNVLWAGDAGASGDSYFDVTVSTTSGDTVLDDVFDAWCVDTDRSIRPVGLGRGIDLQADVYCDCYDVPVLVAPDNPLVENCDNMGKINWILNYVSVGQDIDEIDPDNACADPGLITYGDIQLAIWDLADDNRPGGPVSEWGLGDYDECRVTAIKEAADGEFMPICGEDIGVIILPYVYMIDTDTEPDGIPDEVLEDGSGNPIYADLPAEAVLVYVQPIIIKIPAPCCFCDETAWAGTDISEEDGFPSDDWPDEDSDGYKYEFPGKNWAMFFTYPEDAVIATASGKKGK